jgi:hypothetical protein
MVNRETWVAQIKKDYPNVPDFIVNWMLDIHERDPEYFKKEMKKQKGRPRKDSVKASLSNLNAMADKMYELKNVQIKYAEKPPTPVKVGNDGYIKEDFS